MSGHEEKNSLWEATFVWTYVWSYSCTLACRSVLHNVEFMPGGMIGFLLLFANPTYVAHFEVPGPSFTERFMKVSC